MKFKKTLGMLAIILACSAFGSFSMPDDADAKRFGSSRSIGRTVTRPATPGFTRSQSTTQQRNMANQGGVSALNRTGMFGGLFGGLLAGTLLGSLLGGGGVGGGIGLFDILILGLIGFFAYRFFKSRNQNNNQNTNENQNNFQQNYQEPENYTKESNAWGNLRSERSSETNTQADNSEITIPAFNEEEFLEGAKQLYVRMQESWDMRDLNDIKLFTSEEVYKEIQEQYKEDPNPSKTELLLINCHVVKANAVDSKEFVSVLFDVLLKEQENENNEQVKEIWNFTRDKNADSMWKLDGIQQA